MQTAGEGSDHRRPRSRRVGRRSHGMAMDWGPAPPSDALADLDRGAGGEDMSDHGRVDAEQARLEESRRGKVDWKQWGPYLSERQWGTVREDYSEDGNAWAYFTHDQARSRAYRWGEDLSLIHISEPTRLLSI